MTKIEARLRKRYTSATSIKPYGSVVYLKVNQQSFAVTPYPMPKHEASWMRTQLAKALATIISESA